MNIIFDISTGEILKIVSETLTWDEKQVYLDGTNSILVVPDDTDTQGKKVNIDDDGNSLTVDEKFIRKIRNTLLKETDWTQLEDAPFTDSDKNLWKIYRQELRDVPSQIGFPTNIIWPSKPK